MGGEGRRGKGEGGRGKGEGGRGKGEGGRGMVMGCGVVGKGGIRWLV